MGGDPRAGSTPGYPNYNPPGMYPDEGRFQKPSPYIRDTGDQRSNLRDSHITAKIASIDSNIDSIVPQGAEAVNTPAEIPKKSINEVLGGKKNQSGDILRAVDEFTLLKRGAAIENPEGMLQTGNMSPQNAKLINAQTNEATISRKVIKHIIEQRGDSAKEIIQSIPDILSNPSKIVNNSAKRPDSFLFAKKNGKNLGTVLEVTKTPDGNRVVTAFQIDNKTYEKLVDISGRTDVPPIGRRLWHSCLTRHSASPVSER